MTMFFSISFLYPKYQMNIKKKSASKSFLSRFSPMYTFHYPVGEGEVTLQPSRGFRYRCLGTFGAVHQHLTSCTAGSLPAVSTTTNSSGPGVT